MVIRSPLVWLMKLAWIGFFVWLCLGGDSLLPDLVQRDSATIMAMAGNLNAYMGSMGQSYWNVAVFFHVLGQQGTLFLLVSGVATLLIYLWRLVTPWGVALAVFICSPAVLMGMVRPQKEAVVTVLALATYAFATQPRWPAWVKVPVIVALYCMYASLFRDYYYVIALVFVLLLAVVQIRHPLIQLSLVPGSIAALLMTPISWLEMLEIQRDKANQYRVAGSYGARSMVSNPYPIDSHQHFVENYAHAFVHLNLPALFSRHPKDVVMNVATLSYVYLLLRGLRAKLAGSGLLVALFASHALVLCLFEPDLGSYFRHISSVFLYLVPGLMMFELDVPRVALALRGWWRARRAWLKRRGLV